MPIIPNPGPRPTVTPRTEGDQIQSDVTIAQGDIIHQTSDSAVFVGFNNRVTNAGTIWLESGLTHGWLIAGGRSNVENTGLIYINGLSQVELSPALDSLINSGSIFVISEGGWARGVRADDFPVTVDNSGLIAVQSRGLDPNTIQFANATGIEASNTVSLINRVGGQILVEGINLAIGVETQAANIGPDPLVTNEGLIEASATAADGFSVGVYLYNPGFGVPVIVNSGTIRAEFSIIATYRDSSFTNTREIIENRAGGVLDGHVFLDTGDDQMTNNGSVIGNVRMGDGADLFTGTGSVTGVVDMGFGDDTYSGGTGSDRATGGRGNDTLSGGLGNDILTGGFGDDVLRGDGGNDALYGEWGNDIIYTLDGDFVDAGTGDDRVILGDYRFASVAGGAGLDTLVLAAGARNFSLAAMVSEARISGFEILELQSNQSLVVTAPAISGFTDKGDTIRIIGTASNSVSLDGAWTRLEDTEIAGVSYQAWISGSARVVVSLDVSVQSGVSQSFSGLDAVASGPDAPQAGVASGLELTDPATFMANYIIGEGEFSINSREVFFSNGGLVFTSIEDSRIINRGEIYSIDNRFPSSLGVDVLGRGTLVNYGLINVEQQAIRDDLDIFYYPSFAVRGGGSPDNDPLENYGDIIVYSVPGSAIAVHNFASLINGGLIAAISETSRAIAVNAVYGSHIIDGGQTFINTGVIYAEGGGPGRQTYIEGDRFVPDRFVATGVQAWGSLVNSGQIRAVLGSNATGDLETVGVYAMNLFGNAERPSEVTNHGLIEAIIAIAFEDYGTGVTPHRVTNSGLLIGDVHFLAGNDTYNNSNGETRGTVFGFDGDDSFTGGRFADIFNGGLGNDTLNGGGNVDTVIVSGNRSAYTITQTSVGVFQIVGPDGTDTLTAIEYLQFDDQTMRLLPGTGVTVNFATADPSVYQAAMNNIRDFDGNALGGDGGWLRIGSADVNGDGDLDQILVNRTIGRFATIGTASDGQVYFSDHGWAGETRVAGIYIDPLVANGQVVAGSGNDSQRRFQNDLEIENINRVLGADDYDNDGIWEVYFALTDGTAYLRALMHADGNIRYANYQSRQEVIDYLTANGYDESTFGNWFPSGQEQEVADDKQEGSDVLPDTLPDTLIAGLLADMAGADGEMASSGLDRAPNAPLHLQQTGEMAFWQMEEVFA